MNLSWYLTWKCRNVPIGLSPKRIRSASPGGLNLYGYANGDPVNFSDPFGLCPPEDTNLSDCPTGTEGERHLLRAYATLERHGGRGVLESIVDNGIQVSLGDGQSVVQACGAQTRGCLDGNQAHLLLASDHVETAVRLTHEVTHADLALSYPREEVLAWRNALTFYGGLNRRVPFYEPRYQAWLADPAAFLARIRAAAVSPGRNP